ncbi:hypothetical protein [Mucilaginibacter sp. BT774]|uniref:hypothetical protein n=1 Tax=Mucilaginibacter sp. BT774 TaxID=3062276 RepID=UPI0026760EFF|nr:hypothetical protein [Mucilaginibacter sp. BT774]MDO3625871.1 hypothetical protein [Mucilaginibacter sp. BT774]
MKSLLTVILLLCGIIAIAQDKSSSKEYNAYDRDGKTIVARVLVNANVKSKLFLIKSLQRESTGNSYVTTLYFGNKETGPLTDTRILLKFSKPVISVMPHFATAFKSMNGLAEDHNTYTFKAGRLERDAGSAIVIYFTIKSKDRIVTEVSGLDGILQ